MGESVKVPPEVKRAFEKLKAENAALRKRNADLEVEVRELLDSRSMANNPDRVVTTQQTAKVWKGLYAAGVLVMLIGFFVLSIGFLNQPNADGLMIGGVVVFVLGLLVWIFAKTGKFWYHE